MGMNNKNYPVELEDYGEVVTMSDKINTKSIGKGIATVEEDFILREKPMSRLVFQAQIHLGGIKGKIIRQRRESDDDSWQADKAINIRSLGKNESINIDLGTEAVKALDEAITKLKAILQSQGIQYGEHSYAVVGGSENVIVTDRNKVQVISSILEKGYGEAVWNDLAELNPSLATKLSVARIQADKRKIVNELETRLNKGGFKETAGADSWQTWIYRNNWLFGVNYQTALEKTKINISGSMPDYLFLTVDGFIDILEIKLPSDEVVVKDSSHEGAWKWSSETNVAIGQVVNYLGDIERQQLEIERHIEKKYDIKVSSLKPRAYILIGNSLDWQKDKKEGLRKLNHALHGIEVITYKELIDRGHQAIKTIESKYTGEPTRT